MKKIYLIILLSISFGALKAQLFNQSFTSSTVVGDYVSLTPNTGQFTSISNATNNPSSITANALRYTKTGGSSGYFARNTAFAGPPTFLQVKFDFTLSGNTNTTLAITQATFFLGSVLGDGATEPANSNIHSKFAFSFDLTSGSFYV